MSNGKWLNRAGVSFISGAIALAACSAMAGAQNASDEPASNPAQQAPPQTDPPPRRPDRAPPGREANRPERPTVALTGTIQSFNLNPDGLPESLMLKTNDQLVQVNFPPPISAMINQVSPAGSAVHLQASPDLGLPDHPVYLLRSLKSDKTEQTLAVPTPGQPRQAHVEGTIKQLNYGHHGEINGVLLDSGDQVRFPPDSMSAQKLETGQKLSADGRSRPMLNGHQTIDADSIDGKKIEHPRPPHDHRPGADRDGRRPPGPRGEGFDPHSNRRHEPDRGPGADRGPRNDRGPSDEGGPGADRERADRPGHRPPQPPIPDQAPPPPPDEQ